MALCTKHLQTKLDKTNMMTLRRNLSAMKIVNFSVPKIKSEQVQYDFYSIKRIFWCRCASDTSLKRSHISILAKKP